jgi:hypothetical protein
LHTICIFWGAKKIRLRFDNFQTGCMKMPDLISGDNNVPLRG